MANAIASTAAAVQAGARTRTAAHSSISVIASDAACTSWTPAGPNTCQDPYRPAS
jgi:hypothetical protein